MLVRPMRQSSAYVYLMALHLIGVKCACRCRCCSCLASRLGLKTLLSKVGRPVSILEFFLHFYLFPCSFVSDLAKALCTLLKADVPLICGFRCSKFKILLLLQRNFESSRNFHQTCKHMLYRLNVALDLFLDGNHASARLSDDKSQLLWLIFKAALSIAIDRVSPLFLNLSLQSALYLIYVTPFEPEVSSSFDSTDLKSIVRIIFWQKRKL